MRMDDVTSMNLLALVHAEGPKLNRVLALLSAIELNQKFFLCKRSTENIMMTSLSIPQPINNTIAGT